jgi:hypothetical protein
MNSKRVLSLSLLGVWVCVILFEAVSGIVWNLSAGHAGRPLQILRRSSAFSKSAALCVLAVLNAFLLVQFLSKDSGRNPRKKDIPFDTGM